MKNVRGRKKLLKKSGGIKGKKNRREKNGGGKK